MGNLNKKIFSLLIVVVVSVNYVQAMDNPLFEGWVDTDKKVRECNIHNTRVVNIFKLSDALKCSAILAVPFVTLCSGQSVYDYTSSLPMSIVGGAGGGMLYSAFLGATLFPKESMEFIMAEYKASFLSYESRVKRMQKNS